LPLDDLDKLLTFMKMRKLTRKHARLVSLLGKFRDSISDNTPPPLVMDNQELQALNADLTMDKVGGLTLSFVASASQIAQSVEARAHIHKAREVKNKEK